MPPTNHVHVSEREPTGHWWACEWCSGVMLARQVNPAIPATLAEAHALCDAAHAKRGQGATAQQLQSGLHARYGYSLPVAAGFSALWAILSPGVSAAAQGSMANVPASLRRYDPAFKGDHCVFLHRVDGQDRVWWDDPLAPKGSYNGQWVGKADLQKYVSGMAGAKAVIYVPQGNSPNQPAGGDTMPALLKYLPGYTTTVEKGVNIRPDATLISKPLRKTAAPETWVIIGTVKGDKAQAHNTPSTEWVERWAADHYEYATITACSTPIPPTGGYTQAQLDAAVKQQADADAAAKASAVTEANKAGWNEAVGAFRTDYQNQTPGLKS